MSESTDRVLIAGGGIAGLATAAALGRRGIPSVVLERRDQALDAGLGINLPLQLNFMAFALPGAVAAIAMTVFAISSRRSARQQLPASQQKSPDGAVGEVS